MLKSDINEMTVEDWVEEYKVKGTTLKKLSEHFGVHLTTISNRIKKAGISGNKCGHKDKIKISKEEMFQMYIVKNLSFVEISKLSSCTESSVRRLIDKHKIKRKNTAKTVLTEEFLLDQLKNTGPYGISKYTGFSVPTIYKYLNKFGIQSGKDTPRRRFSDRTEEVIAQGYAAGKTIPELAKVYKASTGCINAVLCRQKVDMRTPQDYQRKLPGVVELKKLYFEDKLSIKQIADKFNVSIRAIWGHLRHFKLRSKSESLLGEANGMFGNNHSAEARSSMAEAYISGVREYPDGAYGFYGSEIKTPNQGVKTTRSTWETLVAEYFNTNGIDYYYEPKTFRLMDTNGSSISYLPDFYLPTSDLYVEIKGYDWHGRLDKVDLFREQEGSNIEVWRQETLIDLGIL